MDDVNYTEDLIYRLIKRAEIRRQISTRKSVQEGKPDRISDLLEEAAKEIETLQQQCDTYIDTLIDIVSTAHSASTGPAVPDTLWEVRAMAYDALRGDY